MDELLWKQLDSSQQTRAESSYGGCIMIPLSRYEAGEVIIQENDLGETAYVINQGQVEVSKELQGQKVHLLTLGLEKPLAK